VPTARRARDAMHPASHCFLQLPPGQGSPGNPSTETPSAAVAAAVEAACRDGGSGATQAVASDVAGASSRERLIVTGVRPSLSPNSACLLPSPALQLGRTGAALACNGDISGGGDWAAGGECGTFWISDWQQQQQQQLALPFLASNRDFRVSEDAHAGGVWAGGGASLLVPSFESLSQRLASLQLARRSSGGNPGGGYQAQQREHNAAITPAYGVWEGHGHSGGIGMLVGGASPASDGCSHSDVLAQVLRCSEPGGAPAACTGVGAGASGGGDENASGRLVELLLTAAAAAAAGATAQVGGGTAPGSQSQSGWEALPNAAVPNMLLAAGGSSSSYSQLGARTLPGAVTCQTPVETVGSGCGAGAASSGAPPWLGTGVGAVSAASATTCAAGVAASCGWEDLTPAVRDRVAGMLSRCAPFIKVSEQPATHPHRR
jgi:hypothetical protein